MGISTRLAAGIATAVTIALGALPAAAAAACPAEPTSQAFSHLGDHNDYFLAPGGDFEGDLIWAATGAAGVGASGSNGVDSGTRAARLPHSSSLTSPSICFDAGRPHLRFAARATTTSGTLRLDAIDASGDKILLAKLEASDYPAWAVTPNVALTGPLQLTADKASSARLRVTSLNGEWLVDAVYVDPYMRG